MRYRLAIFDFDGTLADSFPFFLSVFNTIADRHGFKRIDVARAGEYRGQGMREMMARVGLPAWKLPLAANSFRAMMRDNAGSIALFDGIPEALRHLAGAGVRLAVVSSNAEHNVRTILGPELAGLVGSFDCGMSVFGKTGHIRAVLRRVGIEADVARGEALYVGDQDVDAQAAHRAGVAFGAVHWGFATIESLRRHGCTEEFAVPADLRRIAGRP